MREEAVSRADGNSSSSVSAKVIVALAGYLEAMKLDGVVPRLKRRLGSGAAEARLNKCDAEGAFLGASDCCVRARTQAALGQVHNSL